MCRQVTGAGVGERCSFHLLIMIKIVYKIDIVADCLLIRCTRQWIYIVITQHHSVYLLLQWCASLVETVTTRWRIFHVG